MNILILSWRGPDHPQAGGAEQVIWQHAKGWVNSGHLVTLLTATYKQCKLDETRDGIRIKRWGDQFIGVRLAAFFWYWLGKHPKVDLVVDEFHGIPFFTPLWARRSKILGFIHEVATEVWGLNAWPKPFNLIPAVIGKYGEPWLFRLLYSHIPFMTVSESTKSDLVDWGIPLTNITVVHNGVELDDAPKDLPPKEQKYTAIFLGAVSRDKGIEDALKTFALVNKNNSNWQFWIAGSASLEMKQLMTHEIAKLDLTKSVKYWGYVTDARKFDLLARAHVLVNTSIHEGWGLVNIEANAVGTPVVAYNVQGIKDSVKNGITGILVDKGDYKILGKNTIAIVTNTQEYSRFRRKCIEWAANFTWKKAQAQSLKLINDVA